MKKHEAISMFGSQRNIAVALGISRSAVSQWPDDLPQRLADEIIGAALRTGKKTCLPTFKPDRHEEEA